MSVVKRARHGWLLAPALACSMVVGCSDDDEDDGTNTPVDSGTPDTGVRNDSGVVPGIDSGIDGGVVVVDGGGGGDAGPSITDKTVIAQVSATGHDRYYGVTYDSAGNIYAVGQTAAVTTAGADSSFLLAKYNSAGALDTTFGTGGYAIQNVVVGGGSLEQARAVVVQPSGKIVVAGYAEHAALGADAGLIANDSDIFLARFNADGKIDTTFGTGGVQRHDIGTAIVEATQTTQADGGVTAGMSLRGPDVPWSLSQSADGTLVVHTQTRALGNSLDGGVRYDSDFALVRLTPDGVLDSTFGAGGPTPGVVRTDFNQTSASVRSATVLANGSIVGAGYSTNKILSGTSADSQNPVIYKVNKDGTPDPTFGGSDGGIGRVDPVEQPGVWHGYARRDMQRCEAYGAAPQGEKFVTIGYGATPLTTGSASDLVWFRFNSDGTQDDTFGTQGATFQDVGGLGDNGYAVGVFADDRIVGAGRGRPKPAGQLPEGTMAPLDAVVSVLTPSGQPDLAFGPGGLRTYNLGGPGDVFWGLSVAPGKKQVAAVGIASGATAADDDDAALLILNIP